MNLIDFKQPESKNAPLETDDIDPFLRQGTMCYNIECVWCVINQQRITELIDIAGY